MQDTVIDSIVADNKLLTSYLERAEEWSMRSTVDGSFRKVLLMSAASYFEFHICASIVQIFSDKTNGWEPVGAFTKNKGISRQYHSFFNWDGRNANSFFALFGPGFKQRMENQVKNAPALQASVKSFLELGELRNGLTHLNFANYPLDKTVDEIYVLYQEANLFVETFLTNLRDFVEDSHSTEK